MPTPTPAFEPIMTLPKPIPTVPPHALRSRHHHDHASPDAIDEVFANLAARQERIGQGFEIAIDAAQFRDTAAAMSRQRERLAQLLRDIEATPTNTR